MSSLMFVFLSGRDKGKTRIYQQDRVTIGTSDASDLALSLGGARSTGKLFEAPEVLAHVKRVQGSCQLIVKSGDVVPIAINGERVPTSLHGEGVSLYDGDTLRFGEAGKGVDLLFHLLREDVRGLARVGKNAHPETTLSPDAPATVHPLTATLFVKELATSLWAEIPSRAKAYTLGGVFAILGGLSLVIYLNFLQQRAAQNQIIALQEEIERDRRERDTGKQSLDEQRRQLDELRQIYEGNRTFAQRVSEQYGGGVCLIVGTYSFADKTTGKPLRYETADAENGTIVGDLGELTASIDGLGSPVEVEFSGTGFLVGPDLALTNRHVIQPWWRDDTAQLILQRGMRAKVETLYAYFPQRKTPFVLRVAGVSQEQDLAVVRVALGDVAPPVLPVAGEDAPPVLAGRAVVLLGYPAGVEALVERLSETDRAATLGRNQTSALDVAKRLADRGAIRPLTTQGIIGDVVPGRIVHNAATAEGGSGGPLFDESGNVIGINSAILVSAETGLSFPGSNFGIPISAASALIKSTQAKDSE